MVARVFDAGGSGCALAPPAIAGSAARVCDLLERGREAVGALRPHGIASLVWDLS